MEAKGDEKSGEAPSSEILVTDSAEPKDEPSMENNLGSGDKSANQQEQKDNKGDISESTNSVPDSQNEEQPVGLLAPPACKRVRFSVCEYITETLVQENGHTNSGFENEPEGEKDNPTPEMESSPPGGGSKVRYIGGKLRRDSVHPLVPFHPSHQKKDPWNVISMTPEDDPSSKGDSVPWSDLSSKGKLLRVLIGVGKFLCLLILLYFFVCSLDLLSLGFRLVGGSTAGEIFQKSSILQNPVVGLMLGILTTVLVQSSSTSSSILVGMVAAGFLDVRLAIPPIMGANIGTSITNTIVSFTQASDRDQFRRAFAGATVLDMFNWITVLVLLPIEVIFGYLYYLSKWTVDLIIPDDNQSGGEIQVLSVLTRPFVDLIVQLNDTVLACWANPNCTEMDDASLISEFCSQATTEIQFQERVVDLNGREVVLRRDVIPQKDDVRCDFLFAGTSLSDAAVGAIILVASLIVLCTCLVLIVKLLSSVMKGHVSTIIKHTLNANIPYVPWITGYLAILIGAFMTFVVQSSSVFTSALTPLVGLGVISLERVYPLTLGANIGTTTTALLASMAAKGNDLQPSLQIALCHFFFNMTGVLLFYPVPFLRFPIPMAKALGNITAKYRWFAILYLVLMFALLPALFISLSLAGSIYVVVLISLVGAIVGLVAFITILQRKLPHVLPQWLRNWKWLPRPMRSLKPYDKVMSKLPCCAGGGGGDEDDSDSEDGSDEEGGYEGRGIARSKLDGGFVFLQGNKIPPPGAECGKRIITRIVPTRVIRNISNGDYGGYQTQKNEKNGGDVRNGSLPPPPTSSPPTNGTIGRPPDLGGNNTLPVPAAGAYEESLSLSPLQQATPTEEDKPKGEEPPKSNGAEKTASEALESFLV